MKARTFYSSARGRNSGSAGRAKGFSFQKRLVSESSSSPDNNCHQVVKQRGSQHQSLRAVDLSTDQNVSVVLDELLRQCDASDAAAALVPWFCDALPSSKSRKDYFADLSAFFAFMRESDIHPFDVTGDHVRLYKEAMLQSGKKAGTVARALSVLRGTYQQFGKKSFVAWDIVSDIQAVTSPRVDKNTTPALSEKEAIALLEAPDISTPLGMRDQALLFVYFKTACRSSAIAKAKVGDLERTDTDWYLVVTEKGNRTRRLALLESAPFVLRWIERAEIQNDPLAPLFPALDRDRKTPTTRHLAGRTILYTIKKYARQVGLEVDRLDRRGICTHSLRKTALNNALKHGAKIEQVQQWAGHQDIRTTQEYIEYHAKDAETAARFNQIRPKNA